MKGAWRAAVAVLAEAGVSEVFGLPGDDLAALEAIAESDLQILLCRDQRNAVFMATGYAMQSGGLGVALVGKGPAVTNTITGLLEASCSAAPVLLLSGGTPVEQRGGGAFQELDQLSVVRPMVKWAARVDHPARVAPMLRRAILVARGGAPGPVYLELPDHLLTEDIPVRPEEISGVEYPDSVTVANDSPALRALRSAAKPIVLVGGGMRHRNQGALVERFAQTFGAAVLCTASGRGAADESFPLFCGLSGLYLPTEAAPLLADTDCVITLGSRLEETAVFQWPQRIGSEVPVIQVNTDAAEFATGYAGPKVLADGRAVLRAFLAHGPVEPPAPEWLGRVLQVHQDILGAHQALLRKQRALPELHISEVLDALDAVLPSDRILVQENGLQDMWSYRFPMYRCAGGAGSIVPSEQTSLGFGAAAAFGVRRAAKDRPVVAFVGDGALDMVDSDLATAIAHGGGLLYVVLRNGGYGWLQAQLDQRKPPLPGFTFAEPALAGSGAPDLPGLHQITVTDKAELIADVTRAWKLCDTGRVVVLNVPVRREDALFGAGGDFPDQPGPA